MKSKTIMMKEKRNEKTKKNTHKMSITHGAVMMQFIRLAS